MCARVESDPAARFFVSDGLEGQVAFVTEGTRGLGAAICRSLASHGATVAAAYGQNVEKATRFQFELEELGASASIHQGNVGSAEDCHRTVREVIDLTWPARHPVACANVVRRSLGCGARSMSPASRSAWISGVTQV